MSLLHIGFVFTFCITRSSLATKDLLLQEMHPLARDGIEVVVDADWVSNIGSSTYNGKHFEVEQSVLLNGEAGPVEKLRMKFAWSPKLRENFYFEVSSNTDKEISGTNPGNLAFWFHDVVPRFTKQNYEDAAAIPLTVNLIATNWKRTLKQSNKAALEIVSLPDGNFGFRMKRREFFVGDRGLNLDFYNALNTVTIKAEAKCQNNTKMKIGFKDMIYVYLRRPLDGPFSAGNLDFEAANKTGKWRKSSFERVTLLSTNKEALQVSFSRNDKSKYVQFRLKEGERIYVVLEGTDEEWLFFTAQRNA